MVLSSREGLHCKLRLIRLQDDVPKILQAGDRWPPQGGREKYITRRHHHHHMGSRRRLTSIKRRRLEAAGWGVASAEEFLGLSPEVAAAIESNLRARPRHESGPHHDQDR